MPAGADAVVLIEEARVGGDELWFEEPLSVGRHVRRAGEDIGRGALALPGGRRLSPHAIGLAASLDQTTLTVVRRPRVCIVCTGDELRYPGEPGPPDSLPESNGLAVALQCEAVGASAELAPLSADAPAALAATLAEALRGADLLITIGGVSVGKYDLVRPALQSAGVDLQFWKVAIKPGKPLAYGRHGSTRILGLPGNPVSAQITFALFGLPLLRALQGERHPTPRTHEATLLEGLEQAGSRRGYYRARREGDGVRPLGNQASGNVVSLAHADALVVLPQGCTRAAAGARVRAIWLDEL